MNRRLSKREVAWIYTWGVMVFFLVQAFGCSAMSGLGRDLEQWSRGTAGYEQEGK